MERCAGSAFLLHALSVQHRLEFVAREVAHFFATGNGQDLSGLGNFNDDPSSRARGGRGEDELAFGMQEYTQWQCTQAGTEVDDGDAVAKRR